MIQMLAIDIGHGRDRRRQTQERAVAFVRFSDEEVASPQSGMTAKGIHLPSDHHRVQPALCQHIRHHRGRRRLAVRAGNGHAELQAHQLRQHLRARDDRDLPRLGGDDFGVGRRHRGGNDHHLRFADVRFMVADGDPSAQFFQPSRRFRLAQTDPLTL